MLRGAAARDRGVGVRAPPCALTRLAPPRRTPYYMSPEVSWRGFQLGLAGTAGSWAVGT